MSLKGRLDRLEQQARPPGGICPDCPPLAIVTEDEEGNLLEGAYPEPCPTCGGSEGIRFIVVVQPSEAAQGDVEAPR